MDYKEALASFLSVCDVCTHPSCSDCKGCVTYYAIEALGKQVDKEEHPKHGYWAEEKDGVSYYCSACDRNFIKEEIEANPKVCPYCGAIMDEKVPPLVIRTPAGVLLAEIIPNKGYPGISLSYLYSEGDEEYERDVAIFEWDDTNQRLRLAVWGDKNQEDYTDNFDIAGEEEC